MNNRIVIDVSGSFPFTLNWSFMRWESIKHYALSSSIVPSNFHVASIYDCHLRLPSTSEAAYKPSAAPQPTAHPS